MVAAPQQTGAAPVNRNVCKFTQHQMALNKQRVTAAYVSKPVAGDKVTSSIEHRKLTD